MKNVQKNYFGSPLPITTCAMNIPKGVHITVAECMYFYVLKRDARPLVEHPSGWEITHKRTWLPQRWTFAHISLCVLSNLLETFQEPDISVGDSIDICCEL